MSAVDIAARGLAVKTASDLQSTDAGKGADQVAVKAIGSFSVPMTVRAWLQDQPFEPRHFGAPEDGSDAQAALEQMIAEAAAYNWSIRLPNRTYYHSNVLSVPRQVADLIGSGPDSMLVALPGFPLTFDTGEGLIDAPQVYRDLRNGDRSTPRMGNFVIDGADAAPVGMHIIAGTNLEISNIDCQDHRATNLVFDAVQNSLVLNCRLRRSRGANLRVINLVRQLNLMGVHCRKTGTYNVIFEADAGTPGFDAITPGQNTPDYIYWNNGVIEDVFDTAGKSGTMKLDGLTASTFVNLQCVATGALGGPNIQIESGSAFNSFTNCKVNNANSPLPAISNSGFANRFNDLSILSVGSVGNEASNLIECLSRTFFDTMPEVAGSNFTGKVIANLAGSDARLITLERHEYTSGTSGQRPDMSLVDGNYDYFDTTLDKLIVWDFADGIWKTADGATADTIATFTIGSGVTHVVQNTTIKAGHVFEVTAHKANDGSDFAHAMIYATTTGKTINTIASNNVAISTAGNNIRVTNSMGASADFYVSIRRVR